MPVRLKSLVRMMFAGAPGFPPSDRPSGRTSHESTRPLRSARCTIESCRSIRQAGGSSPNGSRTWCLSTCRRTTSPRKSRRSKHGRPHYAAFIERLRSHYPEATIYVATSPTKNDATIKTYLDKIVAMRKAAGDEKVSLIQFPPQNRQADGLGADYHPNIKTHQEDATIFLERLKADLKWEAAK